MKQHDREEQERRRIIAAQRVNDRRAFTFDGLRRWVALQEEMDAFNKKHHIGEYAPNGAKGA